MKTFSIRNTGGDELATIEAESRNDAAVQSLADECCENIRQAAIERDGIDPGYYPDDVVIEEMETDEMNTAAYQYVEESDGQIWKQALCWASDEGFTGRGNPKRVDDVPKGAARLSIDDLEWEPCTEGETVVDAWIAGSAVC